MLTLIVVILFILSVIGTIVCIALACNDYEPFGLMFVTVIAWIATIILFIGLCNCIAAVSNAHTIDSKLQMYEEENARIEESINLLVKDYMDYESKLYLELKSESSIILVSLYPELKSDTLVQQQINLYTSNNDKIRELKEAQIDISKKRWLVNFGR